MQIRDWMAKNVFTVREDTSLLDVTRVMTENNIRRLPVEDNGKLGGIITDRDVKDASPAKTTTLDVHELYYLFSEIKVRDIMTSKPIVLSGDDSLEKAAVIMLETKISGIPVTDEDKARYFERFTLADDRRSTRCCGAGGARKSARRHP